MKGTISRATGITYSLIQPPSAAFSFLPCESGAAAVKDNIQRGPKASAHLLLWNGCLRAGRWSLVPHPPILLAMHPSRISERLDVLMNTKCICNEGDSCIHKHTHPQHRLCLWLPLEKCCTHTCTHAHTPPLNFE